MASVVFGVGKLSVNATRAPRLPGLSGDRGLLIHSSRQRTARPTQQQTCIYHLRSITYTAKKKWAHACFMNNFFFTSWKPVSKMYVFISRAEIGKCCTPMAGGADVTGRASVRSEKLCWNSCRAPHASVQGSQSNVTLRLRVSSVKLG